MRFNRILMLLWLGSLLASAELEILDKIPAPGHLKCAQLLHEAFIYADDFVIIGGGGRKKVIHSNTLFETNIQLFVMHADDRVGETRMIYAPSDTNHTTPTARVRLDGDVHFLINEFGNVRAFDGSGFEYRVPHELELLPARISRIVGLPEDGSFWIELANGTAYQIKNRTRSGSGRESDFEVIPWIASGVENRFLTHAEYFVYEGGLIVDAKKDAHGQATAHIEMVEVGGDINGLTSSSLDLNHHIVVQRSADARHLFVTENGFFIVNGVTKQSYAKFLAIDAAVEITLKISSVAQVGNHVVVLTGRGFLRSFSVNDFFSGEAQVGFEHREGATPMSEPDLDLSECSGTRIRMLAHNSFEVVTIDRRGGLVAHKFAIAPNGYVWPVP